MSIWWRIWLVALFIKLLLSSLIPLTPDEAYYWVWAQHPSLSYFDHPPAIAWLMTLGDLLPSWAVRWPALIVAHFSLWFWREIAKTWLSQEQLLAFLVGCCLMPLVGPGSLVATPDLPLLFSWSFSIWSLSRWLHSPTIAKALVLGLAIGIGILSKYHIVLLGPIGLFLWWDSKQKSQVWQTLPFAALMVVVVSSPVWIWNLQNDWASFRFQIEHGLGRPNWKPKWTRDYLLLQILLLFPTVIALALKSRVPRAMKFAAWFPLAFFFVTSFRGYVEGNWPLVAHPLVLALAMQHWPKKKSVLSGTYLLWFCLTAFVLFLALSPQLPNWAKQTKLKDLHQYDQLILKTESLSPLFARSYQMASILSFYQKREVNKLRGMNRRDLFDSLPGSIPQTKKIHLAVQKGDQLPEAWGSWQKTQVIPVDSDFEIWELTAP